MDRLITFFLCGLALSVGAVLASLFLVGLFPVLLPVFTFSVLAMLAMFGIALVGVFAADTFSK